MSDTRKSGQESGKDSMKERIEEIEQAMRAPDFWSHKAAAQDMLKELQDLKDTVAGRGKYDKGGAVMTIFSGAGGDDAEDFSAMLYRMYLKFFQRKGWETSLLHKNENDRGGYRNITVEIHGRGAYGMLKNESGVHRLVRISPFSSKKLRHTSFSMVEVVPKFEERGAIEIPPAELRVELSRSGGPGGQNVNKRETAVRVVHIPTNLSAHVDSERSQAQNKEKAIEILKGKLYKRREEEQKQKEAGLSISKTTEIEWGNQIRSYVLHPYKMVKDHRTGVEVRDVEKVLEDGEIDEFINAEHHG
ncbi:MAG: PCRF domain-containing protein [Patescibacteria group bacterium]|nr:PCRF domain-containing protein [Patescibacteria group bacterium]